MNKSTKPEWKSKELWVKLQITDPRFFEDFHALCVKYKAFPHQLRSYYPDAPVEWECPRCGEKRPVELRAHAWASFPLHRDEENDVYYVDPGEGEVFDRSERILSDPEYTPHCHTCGEPLKPPEDWKIE